MTSRRIIFRVHAIQRMFERNVSVQNVKKVLQSGKLVEDYSEEMPFPSGLMLGGRGAHPLHVVVADNKTADEAVVITVYEPDLSRWKSDFKSRKK